VLRSAHASSQDASARSRGDQRRLVAGIGQAGDVDHARGGAPPRGMGGLCALRRRVRPVAARSFSSLCPARKFTGPPFAFLLQNDGPTAGVMSITCPAPRFSRSQEGRLSFQAPIQHTPRSLDQNSSVIVRPNRWARYKTKARKLSGVHPRIARVMRLQSRSPP